MENFHVIVGYNYQSTKAHTCIPPPMLMDNGHGADYVESLVHCVKRFLHKGRGLLIAYFSHLNSISQHHVKTKKAFQLNGSTPESILLHSDPQTRRKRSTPTWGISTGLPMNGNFSPRKGRRNAKDSWCRFWTLNKVTPQGAATRDKSSLISSLLQPISQPWWPTFHYRADKVPHISQKKE